MVNLFKRLIAKVLSLFGVKRRTVFEFFGDDHLSRPALNNLDEKLSKYFNYKNGVFLEVGANDGFKQSNTYYLEKILKWNGVLIEGIPDLYNECLKNRSRKNHIVNCALVSDTHSRETIEMHYADLMSTTAGAFGSQKTEQEHIKTGLSVQQIEKSYSVAVNARTLTEVLISAPDNFKNIDFFSLDVEGYEIDVLKGLNFKLFTPKYILIETNNLESVLNQIGNNYKLIEKLTYHDYLFKQITNL